MKLKIYLTLCLTIVFLASIHAESHKVRKLLWELKNTSQPESKIDLFIAIANELKGSFPDSALYYFSLAESFIPEMKKDILKENILIRLTLGRTSVEVAKGNYEKAWELDSLALEGARKLKKPELEAQALMSKGGIFYHQSEFEKAQEINHQALKLVRTTSDYKTEGKILTNMGTIEFMFGNAQKADSLFRIPLQIAERENDDDLLAAGYLNIGLLSFYNGNLNVAKEYFNKSIEVYSKIDGKDGLILCYQNLANTYYQQGDIEKAIEFYTLNINIASELDDKSGLSQACQNLGESYSQIGNFEKALEYFLKSLTIRTTLGDKKGIATTQTSIGHIHYMLGHFDEALDYYRKSLKIYSEIGYALGVAGGYSDVANILQEKKIADSALFYYTKAADFYEKNSNAFYLATVLLNIGKIYAGRNDFDMAEKYYNKAEELQNQTDDKLGIYSCRSLQSNLHYKKALSFSADDANRMPELNIALDYAKKAYNLADKSGNLPGQRESAGLLTDILSKQGNTSEALKFALIKLEKSDSLNKVQRAEALVNAEISWKAGKKQEEINRLQQEKALQLKVIEQKSALANQLLILIAIITIALISIVFAGILFIKNRARQKDIERQKHIIEITRLKMQNINNRLSPHLFFNLLSSVSGEAESTGKIKDKLNQVACLLRKSLENSEQTAIALGEELEMVRTYISLQKSRISEPFTLKMNIDKSIEMSTLVPAMVLQIPVENAIKHGLMPLNDEKKLIVSIRKNNHSIVIKVEDNGIGRRLSFGRTTGTGTGLKVLLQTIRLLNQQNSEPILFTIDDREPQGTEVEITIPEKFDYSL